MEKGRKSWGYADVELRNSVNSLRSSYPSISSLTGLLRMGKTRTNRSATLPQVNKRLQSLEKDYQKLLSCICRNIQIPGSLIKKMAVSDIGKGISRLLASGCVDASLYIGLFPEEIKYAATTNIDILRTILEISQVLQKFSQQQFTPSLGIMSVLHTVTRRLESSPHILFDNHLTQILSWWFPQFIEILSVVLLLSNSASDQSTQVLKDTNTLESYFNCYRANIVIVIYLLSGGYLIDQEYVQHALNLQKCPEKEEYCINQLNQNAKRITDKMRSRLGVIERHSVEISLLTKNAPSHTKKQTNQIRNWLDIFEALPPVCSTCAFLFLQSVSKELREIFGMDIQDFNSRTRLTIEVARPLPSLLDRISKISSILESIRNCWPVVFTEEDTTLLMRITLVISANVNQLCNLETVPFSVPECWDMWLLYITMLRDFVDHLFLLIFRKASKNQAEDVLGKVIVQTKFMAQLQRIENAEECLLSFV